MPKTKDRIVYKVWVEIEAFNETAGRGETVDSPGASVATFNTYEEAYEFAERMNAAAESLI